MNVTINTTEKHVAALNVAELRAIVKQHDLLVKSTGKTGLVDTVWAWVKPQVDALVVAKNTAEAEAEEEQRLALLEDAANVISQAVIEGHCVYLQKQIDKNTETVEAFKEHVAKYGIADAVGWKGADAVVAEELVGRYTRHLSFFSDCSEYTLAQKMELVHECFMKECEECLSEYASNASSTSPYSNVVKVSQFNGKQQWTRFLRSAYKRLVQASKVSTAEDAKFHASCIYVY